MSVRRAAVSVAATVAVALFFSLGSSVLLAEETVVRVGVYENPPLLTLGEENEASGVFGDVLQAAASDLGWRLEVVPLAFADGLSGLENGEIDVMGAVAYSEERDETIDYVEESLMSNWARIVAPPSERIVDVLDLDGRTVAVVSRDVYFEGAGGLSELVEAYGLEVEFVEIMGDYGDVTDAVRDGRADAALVSRSFARYEEAKNGLERTAITFRPVRLHFATSPVSPKGTVVREGLDDWLADNPPDGAVVSGILASYEGLDLEKYQPRLPVVVLATIGALAVLVSLFGVGSAVLQRAVRSRTAELEEMTDNLEDLVEERTFALETANSELEDANAAKSRFLASMSHELRTPLNSIIGFSGILADGMAGVMSEEQLRQVTMINASGIRLLNLVNEILDLSKVEAGAVSLVREVFEVRPLLDEAVDSLRPLAMESGLEVGVDAPDYCGEMISDCGKIRQVILNLLGNAIKFTPRGRVTLAFRPDGDMCRFEVRDTGIGIAPEGLARIFGEFVQMSGDGVRMAQGSGLGLALSQRYAEMLGGRVEAESELGKGSTFSLVVPRNLPEFAGGASA